MLSKYTVIYVDLSQRFQTRLTCAPLVLKSYLDIDETLWYLVYSVLGLQDCCSGRSILLLFCLLTAQRQHENTFLSLHQCRLTA